MVIEAIWHDRVNRRHVARVDARIVGQLLERQMVLPRKTLEIGGRSVEKVHERST